MNTNLLILLIVVLFVILFAGGMLLYRKNASGEIKAGPFSFLFRGSNAADSSTPPASPKQAEPHTKVSNVQVEGTGTVQNTTGKSTHVTDSTFGRDLNVTSSNPTPAPGANDKPNKR
jgi:protein-disulfide isomerase